MKHLMERLGAKRLAALLIGPGLLAVALDSAIAHFAGKGVTHPAQLIPLAYGAAAFVAMLAVALPRLSASGFSRGLRVLGVASAGVGAAGTFFHLKPLLADLSDEAFSWSSLEGAVALAPPLFAPGAFIAIGGLLWVLASPRLQLRIVLGAEVAEAARPAPVAPPQLGHAPAR